MQKVQKLGQKNKKNGQKALQHQVGKILNLLNRGQKNQKNGQKALQHQVGKILNLLNRGQMSLKVSETMQKSGHKVVMNQVGQILTQRVQKLGLQNLQIGLNRQVSRVQVGQRVQNLGLMLLKVGHKVIMNQGGKILTQRVQKLGQR